MLESYHRIVCIFCMATLLCRINSIVPLDPHGQFINPQCIARVTVLSVVYLSVSLSVCLFVCFSVCYSHNAADNNQNTFSRNDVFMILLSVKLH